MARLFLFPLQLLARRGSFILIFATFFTALFATLFAPVVKGATLDPQMLPVVQAATFEVVIPKPRKDPLTYEKPLPFDQLPFLERKDDYNSVGTAFAIGNHHYVTAGHVIMIGVGSIQGEPALRDTQGHVYSIDKITRFSLEQDFVEFTLKNPPDVAPLQVNTNATMNDVVYAVGNAMGDGIVIRDGLYTSLTPEDEDGRWKYIRFSAAASPGNSGGPLLDKNGKVIGVVLMKSPSENLNFALPIKMVLDAPQNLALADQRQVYQLDIIRDKYVSQFKMKFELPLSFAQFSKTYLKYFDDFTDQASEALLKSNLEKLFPNGQGSNIALHGGSSGDPFPTLLFLRDDGNWGTFLPTAHVSPLSRNGSIKIREWGNQILFQLRKPDDISSQALYSDSKLVMDTLLKGLPLKRDIGSQSILITSLGKPSQEQSLTDQYQRRWQIRVFDLPHVNSKVITFLLPVPNGYIGMLRIASPLQFRGHMDDLKILANFLCLDYRGTLAQWKDFLGNNKLLPGPLRDIDLKFDYDKSFSYQSRQLDFSFTPKLQAISADSQLTLGMSYFREGEKVLWDVSGIQIKAKTTDPDGLDIARISAPTSDLDDAYQGTWGKLLKGQHPFDGVSFRKDDTTIIETKAGPPTDPKALYEVAYTAVGTLSDEDMKAKLKLITERLKIKNP